MKQGGLFQISGGWVFRTRPSSVTVHSGVLNRAGVLKVFPVSGQLVFPILQDSVCASDSTFLGKVLRVWLSYGQTAVSAFLSVKAIVMPKNVRLTLLKST